MYNGQELIYVGTGENFYMAKCPKILCDLYAAFQLQARKPENLNSTGQQYKYCEHKTRETNYQQIFTKLFMFSSMHNLFFFGGGGGGVGMSPMQRDNLWGKNPGYKVGKGAERKGASPALYLKVVPELRQ
jgi:hypothetical protein